MIILISGLVLELNNLTYDSIWNSAWPLARATWVPASSIIYAEPHESGLEHQLRVCLRPSPTAHMNTLSTASLSVHSAQSKAVFFLYSRILRISHHTNSPDFCFSKTVKCQNSLWWFSLLGGLSFQLVSWDVLGTSLWPPFGKGNQHRSRGTQGTFSHLDFLLSLHLDLRVLLCSNQCPCFQTRVLRLCI